jgi:hypothetical protein
MKKLIELNLPIHAAFLNMKEKELNLNQFDCKNFTLLS